MACSPLAGGLLVLALIADYEVALHYLTVAGAVKHRSDFGHCTRSEMHNMQPFVLHVWLLGGLEPRARRMTSHLLIEWSRSTAFAKGPLHHLVIGQQKPRQ